MLAEGDRLRLPTWALGMDEREIGDAETDGVNAGTVEKILRAPRTDRGSWIAEVIV